MTAATPFMQFWDALNAQLHEQYFLPELRFGEARRIWEDAMTAARAASVVAEREAA